MRLKKSDGAEHERLIVYVGVGILLIGLRALVARFRAPKH
jgi:hypothetical protein